MFEAREIFKQVRKFEQSKVTNRVGLRKSNFQLFTDCARRSFFNFAMPRDASHLAISWIPPNSMRAAFAKKRTTLAPHVALQLAQLHAAANSMTSRKAFGEESLLAISRWH